jgi:hypothetical protein
MGLMGWARTKSLPGLPGGSGWAAQARASLAQRLLSSRTAAVGRNASVQDLQMVVKLDRTVGNYEYRQIEWSGSGSSSGKSLS